MSKLKGKVAVVTGASKGIGAAIARSLAAEGARVVVNYASDAQGAHKVVGDIETRGGKAIAVKADVASAAQVQQLFAETQKAFGAADILVNNAGVFNFFALEDAAEEEFHRQFNINVLGTLLATREAAKQFGNRGGSVINLSSVVSDNPLPGSSVYAATKGAVDTLTRALAVELAGRRIRVNAIAPGGTETEGTHAMGMVGSDLEKDIVARTPLGRLGQPDDIAKVAVFLASDDSAWLTGERITAAGGLR
jgi:3-oxoacyl-[acyl-carrier protein] reductase